MNKVQLQRRLGIVSNISRLELYGSAGGSSNLGSDAQSWVEIFDGKFILNQKMWVLCLFLFARVYWYQNLIVKTND